MTYEIEFCLQDTFWSGLGSAAGPGHFFFPGVTFILAESNTGSVFALLKNPV
jgi:hypothetical protein